MHDYWFGSYGWLWMIANGALWLAVLGGLVWFVVWAVRKSGSGNNNSYAQSAPSAKEIAQMRYARGEINREQYQQLLEELSR